jgi:hypothetical protein
MKREPHVRFCEGLGCNSLGLLTYGRSFCRPSLELPAAICQIAVGARAGLSNQTSACVTTARAPDRLRWQPLNRANIFLFHRSDRGRKGAERELAVDCGRRIKPLSVPVGSTGAGAAASDYEGSS